MKPRIGIFGLSGCWGEQIVILNCEDLLLDIVGATEIVDFLGGSSVNDEEGPIDVALVEGSVGSRHDADALQKIRKRAGLVVACGTCACYGGIAALAADWPRDELMKLVYGDALPNYDVTPHRPLSALVKVDLQVVGCPMEKHEFVAAVAGLLNGDPPRLPEYAVCMECKAKEHECLLLARGVPCNGPVTQAGCGARCPGYGVRCIGCRGPVLEANFASIRNIYSGQQLSDDEIRRKLRTFAAPFVDKMSQGGAR